MPHTQFRNCFSSEEMNCDVGMLESGVSQRRVAGILNVSQSVVSLSYPRDPSHRHDRGRDRATNQREDRFLLIQSRHQQL